jgi:hypothetical protein
MWRNEDIPGGVVKMMFESTNSGMQASMSSTLMSIEAK